MIKWTREYKSCWQDGINYSELSRKDRYKEEGVGRCGNEKSETLTDISQIFLGAFIKSASIVTVHTFSDIDGYIQVVMIVVKVVKYPQS